MCPPSDLAIPDAFAAAPPAVATASGERWCECPDCGLFLTLPTLAPHDVAFCPRCDAVLQRGRSDSIGRPLVMVVTGLLLLLIASQTSFIELSISGLGRDSTVFTGPVALEQQGMWELAVVVLVTTVLAPLLRMLAILWVLIGIRLPRLDMTAQGLLSPNHLSRVFRFAEVLRPWSMVEVFLLGVFVAYTRLIALAQVEVGHAVYAMAALMLALAAVDACMDREAVWQALDRREGRNTTFAKLPPGPMVGCDICGQVSPAGTPHCARCGARLHIRKPSSIMRTWALLLAAACLYIPANILPVLTLIRLGRGQPSTIVGGAEELLRGGMWPLALLVFVASIMVPVLKLVSLTIMLVTVHRGSAARLQERTVLYRIVDAIGRWSMIDVFMISILTALVRMGNLASVYPGPGALAFCAVVILTILAATSFDPRIMWDAAGERHE